MNMRNSQMIILNQLFMKKNKSNKVMFVLN